MIDADVSPPDRVRVLTCIGCGAMGRQERCEGDCSEHKLVLVSAPDHEALLTAAHAASVRAERLAPVARELLTVEARAEDAWPALQEAARRALREAVPEAPGEWESPGTVTGWWCARCGNVDMPRPCIGVCVWRPAEWVNVALHERRRREAEPHLRAARRLSRVVRRLATVTPRAGQWQRNREALREQARAALQDYAATPPAGAEPPAPPHSWPR